jgi:hypothetical protein
MNIEPRPFRLRSEKRFLKGMKAEGRAFGGFSLCFSFPFPLFGGKAEKTFMGEEDLQDSC